MHSAGFGMAHGILAGILCQLDTNVKPTNFSQIMDSEIDSGVLQDYISTVREMGERTFTRGQTRPHSAIHTVQ